MHFKLLLISSLISIGVGQSFFNKTFGYELTENSPRAMGLGYTTSLSSVDSYSLIANPANLINPNKSIPLNIANPVSIPEINIIATEINVYFFNFLILNPIINNVGKTNIAEIPTRTKCIIPGKVKGVPIGSCEKIVAVNILKKPIIVRKIPGNLCLFKIRPIPKAIPNNAEINKRMDPSK